MSKNAKNYTQFELFPEGAKKEYQPPVYDVSSRKITLSMEHIVGVCITAIVMIVFVFCLGVRKGQNQVSGQMAEVENFDDKIQESAIIIRSDEPEAEVVEAVAVMEQVQEALPQQSEEVEILEIEMPQEVIEDFKYTIQVASFKKIQSAEKEAQNLKKKGFETSVMTKGKYSIVCVGKFNAHQDAKKFSKRLKSRYKDCLVRRL